MYMYIQDRINKFAVRNILINKSRCVIIARLLVGGMKCHGINCRGKKCRGTNSRDTELPIAGMTAYYIIICFTAGVDK